MKFLWWIAFAAVQFAFIAAGLAIVFWTVNSWSEDHRLDAIFGAGVGTFAFFFTWRLIRRWAVEHSSLWRPPRKGSLSG